MLVLCTCIGLCFDSPVLHFFLGRNSPRTNLLRSTSFPTVSGAVRQFQKGGVRPGRCSGCSPELTASLNGATLSKQIPEQPSLASSLPSWSERRKRRQAGGEDSRRGTEIEAPPRKRPLSALPPLCPTGGAGEQSLCTTIEIGSFPPEQRDHGDPVMGRQGQGPRRLDAQMGAHHETQLFR